MKINEIITESASKILYHSTSLYAALQILKDGHFELTTSVCRPVARKFAPKDCPFYLSCTRTLLGGYHNVVGGSAVMVNLDGDFYNRHYKSASVDYWGDRSNFYGRASEAEDRIFSRTSELPIGGITSIHVYVKPMTEKERVNWGHGIPAQARHLLILAKKAGISAYLYEDEKAWRLQDTRKVIPITGPRETLTGPELKGSSRTARSYIEPWLELIHKNRTSDLTERADKERYKLLYSHRADEVAKSLENDITSARKPNGIGHSHLLSLITIMKKNGWTYGSDIVAAMKTKWQAITKSEQDAAK